MEILAVEMEDCLNKDFRTKLPKKKCDVSTRRKI